MEAKSKSNFLINGDANTSFFHAHASIRRNRNQLKKFTSASNVVISNPSDISSEITKEFQERFVSNPRCSFSISTGFALISPIISPDDNAFLISLVLGEEIRSTTFDLAPDKSPGPDGFPPFFFQKYWTLVRNSVSRAVQAFFHSSKILREINHTFLALIPKIDNPRQPTILGLLVFVRRYIRLSLKLWLTVSKLLWGKLFNPFKELLFQVQWEKWVIFL